jgi:hypothetical protein
MKKEGHVTMQKITSAVNLDYPNLIIDLQLNKRQRGQMKPAHMSKII